MCVYGGAPRGPQLRELRRGCHCVVGTPGRMNDLMEGGHLRLQNVEYLVLDEVRWRLRCRVQSTVTKLQIALATAASHSTCSSI